MWQRKKRLHPYLQCQWALAARPNSSLTMTVLRSLRSAVPIAHALGAGAKWANKRRKLVLTPVNNTQDSTLAGLL
jgi:hypothetical protein